MGLDFSKDKEEVAKKIDSIGTTCQAKKQKKRRVKKQKENNNKPKKVEKTPKEKIKQYKEEQKEKSEKDGSFANARENVSNFFEDMIDIFKKTNLRQERTQGSSSNRTGSVDFLFKALYFASAKVKSQLGQIIIDAITEALGCSEDFSFEGLTLTNQPIYLKVSNIDLFKILQYSPDDEFGKYNYEKEDTINGVKPYSMNRQLYHRLQSTLSFSQEYGNNYIGASGNQLMDIKYTNTGVDFFGNPLLVDDYFELRLNTLPNGKTTVTNFLTDYYKSIEIFDLDQLIKNSLNKVFGFMNNALSFDTQQIEELEGFFAVVRRLMGICNDPAKKIDVSGSAKLSDEDFISDGFFEITNQELRNIQEKVNNNQKGVVTFIDCGTVEFPVNNNGITLVLDDILSENSESVKVDKFLEGVKTLAADQSWQNKTTIPTFNLNLDILSNLLGDLPMVVFQTMLSPKVLIGFFVMLKAVASTGTQYVQNLFGDAKEFLKNFKKFAIPVCREIVAIFVEEVFKYIKANIKKLVECLLLDIISEAKNKQIRMYTAIVYTLLQFRQGFLDYRNCKSVIDEILKLLNLASSQFGFGLPSFALQACQFLEGVSQTRALANTIQQLQESGLPTGDNDDGSENLMNIMMDALIGGTFDEQSANSKTEIAFPPTPQFPKGFKLFGKSY